MSTVVVAGALAQRPGIGGHAWVFLQYLLGFSRLGHDVLFLDRLDAASCTDADGALSAPEHSVQLRFLDQVMQAHGGIRYSLMLDDRREVLGVDSPTLMRSVRDSALLLDVMGYAPDEVRDAAPLAVYLDIDPGFGQMWHADGLATMYGNHHAYVTVGTNVGSVECTVPTCGIDWITTLPPVVLDEWPRRGPVAGPITTVASWRGPFAPVDHRDHRFGLRVHEFRKFLTLPSQTGASFEIALEIDPIEVHDIAALRDNGWKLVDPRDVACDTNSYRGFIQRSSAELMIAKGMYVDTKGGWFSDRSACYLASGRPVVVQDTGLEELFPGGEGLLLYSTLDEASTAIGDLNDEYERHAQAARRLAETQFDSDLVLRRLLSILGVSRVSRA